MKRTGNKSLIRLYLTRLIHYVFFEAYGIGINDIIFINRDDLMKTMLKTVAVFLALSTLTACTGSIQNKNKTCEYDYLLHPAISISKIIGGCGDTAQ